MARLVPAGAAGNTRRVQKEPPHVAMQGMLKRHETAGGYILKSKVEGYSKVGTSAGPSRSEEAGSKSKAGGFFKTNFVGLHQRRSQIPKVVWSKGLSPSSSLNVDGFMKEVGQKGPSPPPLNVDVFIKEVGQNSNNQGPCPPHANVDGILKVVSQNSFSKGHSPSPLKGLINGVGLSEDVGFRADSERSPSRFVVGVE